MKSGVVHRNFRLQLCTSAVYYSLGVLGRCVLFYAQYTGGSDDGLWYRNKWFPNGKFRNSLGFHPSTTRADCSNCVRCITVSILQLFSSIDFASRVLCFAFERTVATYFWSWYEKGSPSTICVRGNKCCSRRCITISDLFHHWVHEYDNTRF